MTMKKKKQLLCEDNLRHKGRVCMERTSDVHYAG